jgi:hypothetical protein
MANSNTLKRHGGGIQIIAATTINSTSPSVTLTVVEGDAV